MLTRIKQYIIILILLGISYFILSHHFIFTQWDQVDLLPKEKLTLRYTFFSLRQANPNKVMRIEVLRDAGIGEIMVERGMVSQQKLDEITRRIDYTQ